MSRACLRVETPAPALVLGLVSVLKLELELVLLAAAAAGTGGVDTLVVFLLESGKALLPAAVAGVATVTDF